MPQRCSWVNRVVPPPGRARPWAGRAIWRPRRAGPERAADVLVFLVWFRLLEQRQKRTELFPLL
jgi:hypothetical protein